LKELVRRRPGLRAPGTLDGFEIAFQTLLGGPGKIQRARFAQIVHALGAQTDQGDPRLMRLMPDAARVAEAGAARLCALGAPARAAHAVSEIASECAAARLVLDPSADATDTLCALTAIDGVSERCAREIVMRALHGPDAFPAADRKLNARAEEWRPWRAYAAWHLRVNASAGDPKPVAGKRK
jgi:AraC family transcriptional regulator of adaptative response / DNA-3-methyladenine glycosylase II